VLAVGGAQTLSKASIRNPTEYPIYIERGEGSHVWDVDGNKFIDYMAALGPIILGHSHPTVTKAVIKQARKGSLFSLEGTLTVSVAELLTQMVAGAEMVRFLKSGSDAVSAAIRAARTLTGREVVLVASNSYHGSHNWFQVTQKGFGENGVPKNEAENIRQFEYNDLDSLASVMATSFKPIAAVIIEPARTFQATKEFLVGAKELCHQYGVVLIYDEVVSGFRFSGHTYGAHIGVIPDLTCLGKAMGNGFAVSAVVGVREVMSVFDRCFISGTYHGELIGLAAAKATLQILRDEPVVEHITHQGEDLMYGFEAAMRHYNIPAYAEGIPVCWRQTFTGPQANELKMRFMSGAAERSVLPGLITYVNHAHTDEDIRDTITVYNEVAEELAKWLKTV
jgi:glutamate-1-semialdehyde aminotransferase